MRAKAASPKPAVGFRLRIILASWLSGTGRARIARPPKPAADRKAAVGKIWEPREKSQRIEGSERLAGCAWSMGTSNSVRVAIPPAATRAVVIEVACRMVVVKDAIVNAFLCFFGFLVLSLWDL